MLLAFVGREQSVPSPSRRVAFPALLAVTFVGGLHENKR